MRFSSYKLAVIALIAANIVWGAAFPIFKWSLEDVPPFTFAFFRLFFGGMVLLPFVLHRIRIHLIDLPYLFGMSIIGVAIPITLLFLGLQRTSSINAPIILSSAPIILFLFSFFYLKEKVRKKVALGTMISLFGVMIVIFQPVLREGFGTTSLIGNGLLFIATVGTVIHTVMMKKLLERYHPLTLTFWYFVISGLPLIPFVMMESATQPILSNLTLQGLLGILYGIFFASAFGHALYSFGLSKIKANETGIFAYIDPIATALVAVPLLGEVITAWYIVGCALVFGGIYIAEKRIHYHPFYKLLKKNAEQ